MLAEPGARLREQPRIGLAVRASGKDSLDQPIDSVADVVANQINGYRRQAEIGQRAIAGLVQIGKRVDQCAVEVERYG